MQKPRKPPKAVKQIQIWKVEKALPPKAYQHGPECLTGGLVSIHQRDLHRHNGNSPCLCVRFRACLFPKNV